MFDYHVHTAASFDSVSKIEEIIAEAKAKNITEICIVDHEDYDPVRGVHHFFDRELHADFLSRARCLDFPVKNGIELSLCADLYAPLRKVLAVEKYDYVLAAHHFTCGHDTYLPEYFIGKTKQQAYTLYFEEILETIKHYDDFDCIAHTGYISRGYAISGGTDPAFTYQDYRKILDEIIIQLVKMDKGIEINTRVYDIFGITLPPFTVLSRFLELGGRIVTLGSDSHTPHDVGRCFNEVIPLAKAAGLTQICTFSDRKPTFHRIL